MYARDFFSKDVQQGEGLPESMLRYTTNFLGVSRIPTYIIAVPVAQLGGEEHIQRRATVSVDGGQARSYFFKPAEFVPHRNIYIHDGISVIANPLMNKSPKTTSESLMNHANLMHDDIRVGKKRGMF